MRTIDLNTIYSAEEVGQILIGCVKIETLRNQGGLVGLPGAGYWGADLILAINTMQAQRRLSRGQESLSELHPGDKPKATSQPLTAPKSSRPVENQLAKFRRLIDMQNMEPSKK